jgi:hypothetical protein
MDGWVRRRDKTVGHNRLVEALTVAKKSGLPEGHSLLAIKRGNIAQPQARESDPAVDRPPATSQGDTCGKHPHQPNPASRDQPQHFCVSHPA